MQSFRAVSILVVAFAILPSLPIMAGDGPVPFRKFRLNPQFYSEGINAGDFDHDGKPDIAAGPYYYPGPDFARKVAFRLPRSAPFDSAGDSDCYSLFPFDFNADGWIDLLSTRKDGGAEAVWYENPKGAAGYWPEHAAFAAVQNESAALLDIHNDGKPVLITNSGGFGGWAAPDWARPASAWTFRAVTDKGTWGEFTHGIGAGDLNGDGRSDLIFPTGWWEQPLPSSSMNWKSHAAAFWSQTTAGEGPGGAQILAFDVDGDGDSDVVSSLQAHAFGLSWFENQGAGETFTAHPIVGLPGEKQKYGVAFSQLHALAIADLDGDGLKDLVTGKRKGAHGNGVSDVDSPAVLYWFRLTRPQDQPPKFTPYLIDSEAGIGTQITLADVDGNGAPDILVARRRGTFVFFNERQGSGIFSPTSAPLDRRGRTASTPRLLFPVGNAGKDALGRESGPEP
ncbi:MAG: VCBS repeat-containing protein [Fibrobacteria bacterium]